MKKINPIIIASLIVAFTVLVIFTFWRQEQVEQKRAAESKQQQYEACLTAVDEEYANNIRLTPSVCEQYGFGVEDCNRLYLGANGGRDKGRKECKEQYLSS